MINFEIDGKQVAVPKNGTVMDGANQLGIYIPHFCYHKKLSIAANCRMCLVQVEKAPKPLPACATPAMEGMKVFTHSGQAVTAQKGVMEFLLINHPLDCPICDQGGECQLQDLAVGYGGGSSRYTEIKRVVVNKNLGSLIATDMTRCIHCTRCVRFGVEIGGVMELGQAGRGEHSEIMPFISQTVDSELSGNMIDLCPVGALTSKPFRYTARTWELSRRASISPHDGLGHIQPHNAAIAGVGGVDFGRWILERWFEVWLPWLPWCGRLPICGQRGGRTEGNGARSFTPVNRPKRGMGQRHQHRKTGHGQPQVRGGHRLLLRTGTCAANRHNAVGLSPTRANDEHQHDHDTKKQPAVNQMVDPCSEFVAREMPQHDDHVGTQPIGDDRHQDGNKHKHYAAFGGLVIEIGE